MDDLQKQANELKRDVKRAFEQLNVAGLNDQLMKLQATAQQPDFWNDSTKAQVVMQDIAKLEARVRPWLNLQKAITDGSELLELDDSSLRSELIEQFSHSADAFTKLKEELKLNGPYDDHDAILSIYAGAGGTDAQDWAQMLLRKNWLDSYYCRSISW
jgi:peptide chain release factor 2